MPHAGNSTFPYPAQLSTRIFTHRKYVSTWGAMAEQQRYGLTTILSAGRWTYRAAVPGHTILSLRGCSLLPYSIIHTHRTHCLLGSGRTSPLISPLLTFLKLGKNYRSYSASRLIGIESTQSLCLLLPYPVTSRNDKPSPFVIRIIWRL